MSETIDDAIGNYKNAAKIDNTQPIQNFNLNEIEPDLKVGFEILPIPSKGLFSEDGLKEIKVEYLTTKDEDILTTPSLIENGTVLDEILKLKIKSNINIDKMLSGDKNAILLFLRRSAYGDEYAVEVPDPRTGKYFKTTVDLSKLKYKEIQDKPNSEGFFHFQLPIRKKLVAFRLLNELEERKILQNSEATQEAYNTKYNNFISNKLKAHIVSIDGKSDRDYINKFVDAMPPIDGRKLRKKILEVTPNVDFTYEFTANDGFKFTAPLSMGIDFFFPND